MSAPEPSTEQSPEQPPALAPEAINKRVRVARLITLHAYGALLAFYGIFNYLSETGDMRWWLIQSVPLLIFIPGLKGHHYKTYSWLCFVTLIYFTALVPLVMSHAASGWHWLQLVLIVILFNSAMMTSRWRQRQMINEQQEA